MKIQKILITFILILFISACTFSSPRGSYSQIQLSTNIYRIDVLGKNSTPHQSVKDFALLRASELTLEKNKKRFIIIEDNIKRINKQIKQAPVFIGTQTINGVIEPIYSQPEIEIITFSSGTMTIETINPKDKRYKSAYDAKIIINQLAPILRSKNDDEVIWLQK